MYIWEYAPQREALDTPGLHPVIERLLASRGFSTRQDMINFLYPDFTHEHSPFLLQGMEQAVTRLHLARERGEKVLIHGDYDADGITASALMFKALSMFGLKPQVYIPTRAEGYGVQIDSLTLAKENGCSLVVTVDCGISAVAEVEVAKAIGLDFIITDHHTPGECIPAAQAVINPRLKTCLYPFKELAGVGVAYKLACALLGEGTRSLLDLVAVGTVADVVPLRDENRLYVREGLRLLENPSVGLAALMKAAGVQSKGVGAGHIGFMIAPRLNAAGRLEDATLPLMLLLTQDPARAEAMAAELNEFNKERQRIEQDILEQAMAMVDPTQKALILYSPHWQHGVVGIVASRLVERYYRPTILLCKDEVGNLRGSGRSISGFDLLGALRRCEHTLTRCGGHAMAAGLSLTEEQLPLFRQAFLEVAEEITEETLIPKLRVDNDLDVEKVDEALLLALEALAPFGVGNPQPTFSARHLTLTDKRLVGKENRHLRMTFATPAGNTASAIMFNQSRRIDEARVGDRLQIAYRPHLEEYMGKTQVSLRLQDFRVGAEWWLITSPCLGDFRFSLLDEALKAKFFVPAHEFTPMVLRRQGRIIEWRNELALSLADSCLLVTPLLAPCGLLRGVNYSVDTDLVYNCKGVRSMLCPDRGTLAAYYRYIITRHSFDLTEFARAHDLPLAVTYSVAAASLRIFAELGLIEYTYRAGVVHVQKVSSAVKQELSRSSTFVTLHVWNKEDLS